VIVDGRSNAYSRDSTLGTVINGHVLERTAAERSCKKELTAGLTPTSQGKFFRPRCGGTQRLIAAGEPDTARAPPEPTHIRASDREVA